MKWIKIFKKLIREIKKYNLPILGRKRGYHSWYRYYKDKGILRKNVD